VSAKKCKRVRKSVKRERLVFGDPVTGRLRLMGLAVTESVAGLGEERARSSEIIRDGSMDCTESQYLLLARRDGAKPRWKMELQRFAVNLEARTHSWPV